MPWLMTMSNPAHLDLKIELSKLLESWDSIRRTAADVCPILQQLAELIEKETESYFKSDPDPFDDRHPSTAKPDCSLGTLLKKVYEDEDFMQKLVNDYVMHRDNVALQTVSSRLLYDLLPGLETSVVFNDTEGLVERLLQKAETAEEPLKSYSIGLLAAAMEVQEIAAKHKDDNMHLNPILLNRLKELAHGIQLADGENNQSADNSVNTPVRPVNGILASPTKGSGDDIVFERPFAAFNSNCKRIHSPENSNHSFTIPSPVSKKRRISSPNSPASLHTESNSSWADLEPLIVGSFSLHPLTAEMQQRLILQYLTPMGDYQELLYHVFEEDALGLILHYIDFDQNHDIRLAFEALKYLSSLLCHKKFALEFLNREGLQKLLQVYRPSVAATGVSLCLYYLAYSEDAMERICLLPKHVLTELVSYSMWLLERSHESSKCHATMFFAFSFAFRVILEIFDAQDGLRKLLNAMFILNLFEESEPESNHEQDELMQKRQLARQICSAMKKYFEAHLVIESERVRRLSLSSSPRTSSQSNPGKAVRYTAEKMNEHIETLLELKQARISWKPVNDLIDLGGIKQIMTLIALAPMWSFPGKPELIKSSMDILVVASVVPRMQLKLKDKVSNADGEEVPAMKVILQFLETNESGINSTTLRNAEPLVAQSALRIIINCVCGSPAQNQPRGSGGGRHASGSTRKKSLFKFDPQHMWKCVQENDGIGILLNLLKITVPITEADSIRSLACRALCGLSNCEDIRQIIALRPIFTGGMLQALMKEPVLQDKRTEFLKFVRHCYDLIHQVTGAPIEMNIDTTPENLNRAEVVAQTKVIFNKKQLLQLMFDYLEKEGLKQTAGHLSKEANLPFSEPRILPTPWPSLTPDASIAASRSFSCPTTPSAASAAANAAIMFKSSQNLTSLPLMGSQSSQGSVSIASQGSFTSSPMSGHSKRRSLAMRFKNSPVICKPEVGGYQPSPVLKKIDMASSSRSKAVTLDSIVTEYLRQQHSLCRNPIITCPPFDLLAPHRCPELAKSNQAPANMAMRICRKEVFPKYGGPEGRKFDRKFVYSKFRPIKTFKEAEGAHSFTSCAFSYPSEQRSYGDELVTPPYLFIGTNTGELATFNLDTGLLVGTYSCHDTDITYIEPSRDGKCIITCSIWRSPVSAMWSFTDVFELKMPFEEDFHVEFGKMCQDKAIGTKNSAANLYDLTLGTKICTFHDESISKKYYKNQATFSYTDELVLNDGVLWDVRGRNAVHKFDKFNNTINGVFHPNGWEIIANSEIWDMRTYRLLRTVPALDQCRIKFNSTGDVIYGGQFVEEATEDDEMSKGAFGSSFRTFDATDYSSIATIDIKRNIYDLAVDSKDNYIAIIEQAAKSEFAFSTPDNICKLYEIGRSKEEDEEADDDEEEDDGNDLDDSDDDDEIVDATDDFEHGSDSDTPLIDDSSTEYEDNSDDDDDDDGEDDGDSEDGGSDEDGSYEDIDTEDEGEVLEFLANMGE